LDENKPETTTAQALSHLASDVHLRDSPWQRAQKEQQRAAIVLRGVVMTREPAILRVGLGGILVGMLARLFQVTLDHSRPQHLRLSLFL
jgi:hypothetical protein